jgi:hypothetical protein
MALGIVGAVLIPLFFLPAVLGFFGPLGHCYQDPSCEAEDVILRSLAASQGQLGLFGYPAVALALLLAATRTWLAWILLACLSMIVAAVGVLPIVTGFWETDPRVLGIEVPLVSPGFTFWIAPAIALTAAGVLGSWHGYRNSN